MVSIRSFRLDRQKVVLTRPNWVRTLGQSSEAEVKKLLLLLPVLTVCARGSVVEIVSGTATSGSGLSGTGQYAQHVRVSYSLEQYELVDMPSLPDLRQPIYFRYSYTFSAVGSGFERLILGVSETCAGDLQCLFGIETAGTAGDLETHGQEPGLENSSLHGIAFNGFPRNTRQMTLRFFSNRAPGPEGRLYMRSGSHHFVSDPGAVTTPDFWVLPLEEEPTPTPEPFSMALAGGGLLALAVMRKLRL